MTKLYLLGLLFMVTLLLGSCDENRVFEQNMDIPENNWAINNTLTISFVIEDTTQAYDVYFNIRHALAYEYYNLYVRHTLTGPAGNVLSSLLHEIILLDKKTGKPKGKGFGDIFDYQVRALRNQKFPRPGTYHLKLQQYMRRDPLPGIMSVGIRVEKAA